MDFKFNWIKILLIKFNNDKSLYFIFGYELYYTL